MTENNEVHYEHGKEIDELFNRFWDIISSIEEHKKLPKENRGRPAKSEITDKTAPTKNAKENQTTFNALQKEIEYNLRPHETRYQFNDCVSTYSKLDPPEERIIPALKFLGLTADKNLLDNRRPNTRGRICAQLGCDKVLIVRHYDGTLAVYSASYDLINDNPFYQPML